MAVTKIKSYCRVCISMCGIVVDVDGDKVLRVLGDRDHPVSRGYTCSKGRALPSNHHHPRRLERPQKRVGGALTDTTWDDVLDDISEKLRNIIDESGPRAVGFHLGGGCYIDGAAYLAHRNAVRALDTPSYYSDVTVDAVSKYWVSEMMCGIVGQMTHVDFDNCKLAIFIGQNPMVSHGHTSMVYVPAERLRQLRRQGEVWVIDPRRTDTAVRATRHLAPRPGTDYAIVAYLIREILREGADRDYLEKHAQDVDRLASAVEPFTVERAAAISRLSTAELTDLLAAVRRAGRVAVEIGTGVTMSRECNVISWLSWALMIITGSLDREGGAWFNPGLLTGLDHLDIPPAPPGGSRGPGPASRPELSSICGEYPSAAMPDEIEAGNLRALVNLSCNLVGSLPGTERLIAALKKLDVLATVDIIGNATTEISTHVLPATDQLERADVSYLPDTVYPFLGAQYAKRVVEPVGDRRSYWWILAQIGKRLGLEFVPGIDPDSATDNDVLATLVKGAPVSFDDLQDGEFYVHDKRIPYGWLQRYVDRKLGGWRVAPQELVGQLKTMTEPSARLVMISHRQKKHMNTRLTEEEAAKAILLSPEDAALAGLIDGDRAVVRSDYGALEGIVKVDPNLPNGVLNVPHGWDDDFNANRLTSLYDIDPFTGMAWLSGFPVSIMPAWQVNSSRADQRAPSITPG
jgi:anaerobic selenocysteine-containing dehydrogenase